MFSSQKNSDERYKKKLRKLIDKAKTCAPVTQVLNEAELRNRVQQIRQFIRKHKDKIKPGSVKEEVIVVEAINIIKRVAGLVFPYTFHDNQLLAGLAMMDGRIVEMPNGEGKTLASTLTIFLKYLYGVNVHVITANLYLARRDAEWMGPVFHKLGLRVGILLEKDGAMISDGNQENFNLISTGENLRQSAYQCDVVYGTTHELVFDYLKDNLVYRESDIRQVQGLKFALLDEVDHILIDEARTPIAITRVTDSDFHKYYLAQQAVGGLIQDVDFELNNKNRTIELSDEGIQKIEAILGLENIFDPDLLKQKQFTGVLDAIQNWLKAIYFYEENVDYCIDNNAIVYINEYTGRPEPNQTYSGGLLQAIEIKHGLKPSPRTFNVARISSQRFYKKYRQFSGMTGSAKFDQKEFLQIYDKQVTVVPSKFSQNKTRWPDVVYRTEKEQLMGALWDTEEAYQKKQPVLIGVLSVEMAAKVSSLLQQRNIPHRVLDARHHKHEADIIAHAGEKGAVTISAKMAGRGTDIKLGEGAEELGGLLVLGIERNESKRIDSQLEGRAGRHGKKGESRFILSLEDDLLKIFGADRVQTLMRTLGMAEGEPIEHSMVTTAISNAQKKMMAFNLEKRNRVREYDDVLDKYRTVFYRLRNDVLKSTDLKPVIRVMFENACYRIFQSMFKTRFLDRNQVADFVDTLYQLLGQNPGAAKNPFHEDEKVLKKTLNQWASNLLSARLKKLPAGPTVMDRHKRYLLIIMDDSWARFLKSLDSLEEEIWSRIFESGNRLTWYQAKSSEIYDELTTELEESFLKFVFSTPLHAENQGLVKEKE